MNTHLLVHIFNLSFIAKLPCKFEKHFLFTAPSRRPIPNKFSLLLPHPGTNWTQFSPRRVHIDAENRKRAMCVETQVSPAHFIEGFLCICCADTRGEKRAVIKCTLQLNFRRERKKAILTLEERGRRKYGKGRQEGHGAAQRRWVFV